MFVNIFKNIIRCFKTKYICVDFFQGRLKAVELDKGICIDRSIEEIRDKLPKNKKHTKIREELLYEKYYNFTHVINYFSKLLMKGIKFYVKGYKLIIVFPYEKIDFIEEWFVKVLPNTKLKYEYIEITYIDNLTCVYNSFDIQIQDNKESYVKNLVFFIYKDVVYLGFAFVGYIFNIKPLEKKIEDLSSEDILFEIQKISKKSTKQIPEEFSKEKNKKKELEKIISDWENPFQKTIYFFKDKDFDKDFDIDGYDFKFFKYNEKEITLGMEKILWIERKISKETFHIC
ncbi:hypothetical protein RBH29_08160 [Herbivorax sp. ANBcel31]|uniref:hypothetical protein n=1 Tax=Herbivorax sp. ANBcel31 TaxID=3069754 RepID=UPI0027B326DC|nr:hypothetical protein [Herbivorax sp. ANBcel31]MDQ2086402.1 hypothetical protein [Herbivorax sp. ANBcel31]